MSIVLDLDNNCKRLVTKGASEIVLASCKYYFSSKTGLICEITRELRETME